VPSRVSFYQHGQELYAVPLKCTSLGGGSGKRRRKIISFFLSPMLKFELAMAAFSGLFLPAAEK